MLSTLDLIIWVRALFSLLRKTDASGAFELYASHSSSLNILGIGEVLNYLYFVKSPTFSCEKVVGFIRAMISIFKSQALSQSFGFSKMAKGREIREA